MYIGVNEETGKNVHEDDAFSYACECCRAGTLEEQETFMELAQHCESMEDFAENLVEWYFSGNWLKEVGHAEEL